MNEIDVLIIGAGPTGLIAALECFRYNLSFRIIDENPTPSIYSKAAAIQARSLEVFQRMGILDPFLKEGIKIKIGNIYIEGKKTGKFFFDEVNTPFPFILGIGQNQTEEILSNQLNLNGIKIERGKTLLNIEERQNFIFATVNQEIIKAKYLIGSDGAHSAVRKFLKFSFKGKSFKDVFSLADVKINWDFKKNEIHAFLDRSSIAAIIPLPFEDRYRVILQLKRLKNKYISSNLEHGVIDDKTLQVPSLEEIEKELSLLTKKALKISDPNWIANFHINSRLSNHYYKNSIFLAGDAAHIHSPVGGQGMNTGIQDAFNLIWKIAYREKNLTLNKDLLNSYEKERKGLGKKLLKHTEIASAMITLHSPILIYLRKYLLSFILSFQWFCKKIAKAISQTTISYDEKRADDILLLKDGKEISYYSASIKSTKYHLILFNIDTPPIYHPQLEIFYAKENLKPKALLIRPDGYIALKDHPPFKKLKKFII